MGGCPSRGSGGHSVYLIGLAAGPTVGPGRSLVRTGGTLWSRRAGRRPFATPLPAFLASGPDLLEAEQGFSVAGAEVPGLGMAGSPLADYTGFVCSAGYEDMALAAFADHVQSHLEWRYLEIHDALDPRLDTFLGYFSEPRFRIERHPPTPCPFLELNDSWEAYLGARPRPRMRREIRHDLRAMEQLPGLRRTTVADDGELQISILLELWARALGKAPGTSSWHSTARYFGRVSRPGAFGWISSGIATPLSPDC